MKIKNILLTSTLVLTMTLTGCDSNNKKETNNSNNGSKQKEENDQNSYLPGATMMTKEEAKTILKNNDVVTFNDKDVENSILDELDADKAYRYYYEAYEDAEYTKLLKREKTPSYGYPSILKENDPELKWHNEKYYFRATFSGQVTLIPKIDYKKLDGVWYKVHNLFSNKEHLGNKVVNQEKLKELNKKK